MFSFIVPPVFVDLLEAAPANAAATSMLAPIAKAMAESQSLLLIKLLSI
jgi:hypothetical protein